MLGKDLKRLRERQKIDGHPMTQEELGEITGYTKSAICKIEKDRADATIPARLEKIIEAIFPKRKQISK